MKKFSLSIVAIIISLYSYAQHVEVGAKMPDLPLGETINNWTGKTRFKEFKGKLVILDFWNTRCGSCINGFPHLESLQEKFGDSIQILLVNATETAAQIEQRYSGALKGAYRSTLPMLSNAKELAKLFPHRYMGHTVWIGPDGTIVLRGREFNNHEQKIRAVLAGESISFLPEDAAYVRGKSLSNFSEGFLKGVSSRSIGGFLPGYAGIFDYNNHDTVTHTFRNTFINVDAVMLYTYPYKRQLDSSWQHLLYSNNYYSGWLDAVEFQVKDTLPYTGNIPGRYLSDDNFIKSAYTYEQILPDTLSEADRNSCMIEDLNDYFFGRFGVRVSIEWVPVDCYMLVNSANNSQTIQKAMTRESQLEWERVLSGHWARLFPERRHAPYTYVFNEIQYEGAVPHISEDVHSLEEFRRELLRYGFDLVTGKKKVQKIVFREE